MSVMGKSLNSKPLNRRRRWISETRQFRWRRLYDLGKGRRGLRAGRRLWRRRGGRWRELTCLHDLQHLCAIERFVFKQLLRDHLQFVAMRVDQVFRIATNWR